MTNGNGQEFVSDFRQEEKSGNVSQNFSQSKDRDFASYKNDAEQLADIASNVTGEMTEVLVRLEAILEGFKETLATAGDTADREFGQSLRGIFSAVEDVRTQMEIISAHALAMSSAKLAQMAEALRLDLRALIISKRSSQELS